MGHGIDELALELVDVASGLRFPEGPIAIGDRTLVVEIEGRRLTEVLPDGRTETVAELGGGPNGAALGPDGAVYVCNNGGYFRYEDTGGINIPHAGAEGWEQGSIQRVDLVEGTAETLYTECDGRRLLAPNDLVFDTHGGFWFTDHGVRADDPDGRPTVLYATADGSTMRAVITGLDAPNGIGLSPDGSTMYVAETYRARLWSWAVTGPGEVAGGTLDDATLVHDAEGTALFDSLAVASDGSVCVATLLTGGITIVRPDGDPSFVPTGDPMTTNICFGGPDLRTAWITGSGTGRLLECTWPVAGLGLAHR